MNRTIALLIPTILLAAMALIVFQQFYSSNDETLKPQSVDAEATSPQTNIPPLSTVYTEQTVANNSTSTAFPADSTSAQASPDLSRQTVQTQEQPSQAQTTPVLEPVQPQTQTPGLQAASNRNDAARAENTATQQPGRPEPPTPANTGKTEPASTPSPAKAHKAESFKFQYQGSDMLFVINADSDFEYKSFVLTSPDRLIIDLLGNWSGVENITVPSNRLISGMRNGKTERGHRVVLDLKEAPKGYDTKREGGTLTVRVF